LERRIVAQEPEWHWVSGWKSRLRGIVGLCSLARKHAVEGSEKETLRFKADIVYVPVGQEPGARDVTARAASGKPPVNLSPASVEWSAA